MARISDYDPLENYGGSARQTMAQPLVLPRERYTDRQPLIDNFGRAQHDHSTAAQGGQLNIQSFDTDTQQGWNALPFTLSAVSGYHKGNREFELACSSSPLLYLGPGSRLRIPRSTTAPTRVASFVAASSQYAARASASLNLITFTDDFSLEAIVNLTSYPASATSTIIGRLNSGATNGWHFRIGTDGRFSVYGWSGGAYRGAYSYLSVPLGRKVRLGATINLSANTVLLYVDGVSIPCTMDSGGGGILALTQAGDLSIGRFDGGHYMNGQISDVRIWSTVRTTAEMRDYAYATLTGSESGLIGYWKLDGDFNDSSGNLNHLTATNGAVATTVNHLYQNTEYAIVTKVTSSSITVITGTDHSLPMTGLGAADYALIKAPHGFPLESEKWRWSVLMIANETIAIGAINQWFAANGGRISVPTGSWVIGFQGCMSQESTVNGVRSGWATIASSQPPSVTGMISASVDCACRMYDGGYSTTVSEWAGRLTKPVTVAAQTTFIMYGGCDVASGAEVWKIRADQGVVTIFADCAYL